MNISAGSEECKVDAKGRLRLPKKMVMGLPETDRERFVLNRGFDNNIKLFPMTLWAKEFERMESLNEYNEDHRKLRTTFLSGLREVELDANGRILIPKHLTTFAAIDKEIVITYFGQNIHIWAKERYETTVDMDASSLSDLAQRVFGGEDKPNS